MLVDDYGRSLTNDQLRVAAMRTAASLAERGVGQGTIVSWQLPTTLETMVVMVALTRLGAVQNPILPIWRDSEVRFVTSQLGTEVLIVPGTWRGFDHVALANALAAERTLEVVVIDHDQPITGNELRLPLGDVARLPAPSSSATEARWVYYSSGTTAAPKGVRHSDRSVIAGSAGVVGMVGASSSDVNPIAFPVSHIGGAAMLAASLLTGMRLVLFDAFDPATTPLAIAAHRPTLLGSATPFFVAFMAAQRGTAMSRCSRSARMRGGGAPITPELGSQVRQSLFGFRHRERVGVDRVSRRDLAPTRRRSRNPRSHGRTAGAGVSVRAVADEDRGRARRRGELRLKGPQCFLGYVDETLNADAFDADGWSAPATGVGSMPTAT